MCINLKFEKKNPKQYWIFNKKVTKKQWDKRWRMSLKSWKYSKN